MSDEFNEGKKSVELTEEEYKVLELHRLQTGQAYPDRRIVGGRVNNITYKADAFAREVAKMHIENPSVKELAKAYRRVASTKKPWDRVKDLMADERVLKRIEAYKKVYSTDRDTLLADRECLTMELKEAWNADKAISTGERSSTPKVKTADLLTAYKDREMLYVGEVKKETDEQKVVINISGDVKAMIEGAKAITEAKLIVEEK
jgi:hypothetical protein